MIFASDNWSGVLPQVAEALQRHSTGYSAAYGDGDLDLLIASDGSNSLTILENDGGNFSLFDEIPLADRPQSVAAWQSDLNATPLIAVAGVGTPSNAGIPIFAASGRPARR